MSLLLWLACGLFAVMAVIAVVAGAWLTLTDLDDDSEEEGTA